MPKPPAFTLFYGRRLPGAVDMMQACLFRSACRYPPVTKAAQAGHRHFPLEKKTDKIPSALAGVSRPISRKIKNGIRSQQCRYRRLFFTLSPGFLFRFIQLQFRKLYRQFPCIVLLSIGNPVFSPDARHIPAPSVIPLIIHFICIIIEL